MGSKRLSRIFTGPEGLKRYYRQQRGEDCLDFRAEVVTERELELSVTLEMIDTYVAQGRHDEIQHMIDDSESLFQ